METKNIKISGKRFKVFGHKKDRYFNEYVTEGKDFFDTPIAFLEKHCVDDAVVFDIGANIGLVSCGASTIAPNGTIYAIEASPYIYKYLSKTVRTNTLKNVKPINIAVSNTRRKLSFFVDPNFLAGSRVVKKNSTGKVVRVEAKKLDEITKDLGINRLDIIKLDVEGHEQQVLEGAKKTLRKFKPFCLIEFNSYVMIYENRQLPQDFMAQLKQIFPRIYAFDRNTLGLTEITNDTGAFLQQNLLQGCVDDLVCGFGDLPPATKWFQKNR